MILIFSSKPMYTLNEKEDFKSKRGNFKEVYVIPGKYTQREKLNIFHQFWYMIGALFTMEIIPLIPFILIYASYTAVMESIF